MIRSNRKPIETWPHLASEHQYTELAEYQTIEQRLSRLKLQRHLEPDDRGSANTSSANYQQFPVAGHLRSTVHVSGPHLLPPSSRKDLPTSTSDSGMFDQPSVRQLKRSIGRFILPQSEHAYYRSIPSPSALVRMSRYLKNPQYGSLSHIELPREHPQFSTPPVQACEEMSSSSSKGKSNSEADRTIWKSPRYTETHMGGTKRRIQRLPVRLLSNR